MTVGWTTLTFHLARCFAPGRHEVRTFPYGRGIETVSGNLPRLDHWNYQRVPRREAEP